MDAGGLHNSLGGNCTAPCTPGQSGPPAEYAPFLEKIVASLLAAPALKKTKLLFAITSPDLCNAPIDDIQRSLNDQAAAIMAKNKIPTVDLYKAITTKCGAGEHDCNGFVAGLRHHTDGAALQCRRRSASG
eukprot:COSAG04_NODE_284_length_18146_cov_3.266789_8_plen_131_part_00